MPLASLGVGDAGSSRLLGCLGVGALGDGASGSSSVVLFFCFFFGGGFSFFSFSCDLRPSTFGTRRVFRFLGWV